MFSFAHHRPRRRPSLTPMIDVVFLLLVFFMLATRFGQDNALSLATGGADEIFEGPPRLVTVDGSSLRLNGVAMSIGELTDALARFAADPQTAVFIQPVGNTSLQSLVEVIDALAGAGFQNVSVVAAP